MDSDASGTRAPTGIVLLNLGGPTTQDQVEPFLVELFADREIIQLPAQRVLGPLIARMRTPNVKRNYARMGGGSPLLGWTEQQGQGMVEWLDQIAPATAPHKFYVAFRYAPPFSEDALRQMQADGVKRAVAFTQYPQFSCATTGSSFNELWRAASRLNLESEFRWSVIDRWHTHPGFIDAMVERVQEGLGQFNAADRGDVVLFFSAHSLPLDIIDRGDPYPQEIGASVNAVMERLGFAHEYILAYQSRVGPVQWMGPQTDEMIRALAAKGRKRVLVVPIAFTSDHIETLVEIDHDYGTLARELGITEFKRAPSLNASPRFIRAMADIVADHLQRGEMCSTQYALRCPGCTNAMCRTIYNPALPEGHPIVNMHFTPENYHKAGRPLLRSESDSRND